MSDSLAKGLGWFSLALGGTELAFPGLLGRTLGMGGRRALFRAYGAREIGAGLGLLAAENPKPWLWARVGGDALDLATLAAALKGPEKQAVGIAIATVAAVTAVDVYAATR